MPSYMLMPACQEDIDKHCEHICFGQWLKRNANNRLTVDALYTIDRYFNPYFDTMRGYTRPLLTLKFNGEGYLQGLAGCSLESYGGKYYPFVVVASDYRGLGLARRLSCKIARALKDKGLLRDTIYQVALDNQASIALQVSLGREEMAPGQWIYPPDLTEDELSILLNRGRYFE